MKLQNCIANSLSAAFAQAANRRARHLAVSLLSFLTPLPSFLPLLTPTPSPIYIPFVARDASCAASGESYGLIDVDGSYYKDNRLTDENADLRLSVLGYTDTVAPLALVDYNGDTDPDAPQFAAMFEPAGVPTFTHAFQRFDWAWDESGAPPYGARNGVNHDWPVSALEMQTTAGAPLHPPARDAQIGGGFVAMVLYAGPREITLAYFRQDGVVDGYVVYLHGLCVDPALVEAYRAQIVDGRRATGRLPAVANGQRLGVADAGVVTLAIRDRGTFLDPRSRKDWWQ